ncbi:hypothetical protein [uncultured Winogradskyella sp.]|nr:hypothetical protein [uncultured Winogradskyella sp.]
MKSLQTLNIENITATDEINAAIKAIFLISILKARNKLTKKPIKGMMP